MSRRLKPGSRGSRDTKHASDRSRTGLTIGSVHSSMTVLVLKGPPSLAESGRDRFWNH
ncbi:MAG: hypothetical protein GX621_07710 [Pirellulaceae bacterium]|nr:hypothetical protein [Pirellulaceae bacterium]